MKGESSVLDWREQSYPAWMTSADIGDSCSLSTMLLHAEARKILARMFRELGLEEKAREWEEKSVSLAAVIERFFRIPEHVLYGQYLYGRGYPVLSEKVDSLGQSALRPSGAGWRFPCRRDGCLPSSWRLWHSLHPSPDA